MKPNHKCDPARMALLYIRQQFICTTFKFDAYVVYTSLTFNLAGKNSISCRTNFFPTGTSLLLQTGHTSSDSGSVIITSICGSLDNLSPNCPMSLS